MAREFAKFNVAIWQDDDWRRLPPPAQHLYMVMWSHPTLSYAGVLDWRPGRLAAMAGGWSVDDVRAAAACLEARLFIVTDDDTEEALLRSWVRFDGLMKQPRIAVSYANAFAEVASNTIRGVLVHEAQKLRKMEPDLAGWAKPQVLDMLDLASLDPRARALPDDPFGDGFGHGFTHSVTPGLAETDPKVSPRVSVPPTTATATATYLPDLPDADAPGDDATTKPPRRKPERPLPARWEPNDKHRKQATEARVDVDAEARSFRNHAETHDRRARDWDAAFRTWLSKAGQQHTANRTRPLGPPRDQLPW